MSTGGFGRPGGDNRRQNQNSRGLENRRRCFICQSTDHVKSDCPQLGRTQEHSGSNVVCYNCRQNGHISRYCPQSRAGPSGPSGPSSSRPSNACYKCGKPGHRAAECASSSQQARDTDTGAHTAPNDYSYYDHTAPHVSDIGHVSKVVDEHAAKIAGDNAEGAQVKRDYGLRSSFGSGIEKEVVTNYLTLTPPKRMYVYEVSMVREDGQGLDPIKVTKKADKLLVMQELAIRTPELHDNQKPWVHDGDLIWSTVPLWKEDHIGTKVKDFTNGTFSYANESNTPLNLQYVSIKYIHDIDLDKSVGELFYDKTLTKFDDSIPGILIRGLNAFLTQHARQNASITNVGGNRSFANAAGSMLSKTSRALQGFFVSTRPGTDSLLININTTTSPFFPRCTVLDFLQNLPKGTSKNYAKAILKGVKVQIRNYQQTPNDPRNDIRFVKDIDFSDLHVNLGTLEQPEMIPADSLQIVEYQNVRGALLGDEPKTMIKVALRSPQSNANMILGDSSLQSGLSHFAFAGANAGTNQGELANFGGMSAGTQLLRIKGHWLDPPSIVYGNGGSDTRPDNALWNLRTVRFAAAAKVRSLPILNLASDRLQASLLESVQESIGGALQSHGLIDSATSSWHVFEAHGPHDCDMRSPAYEEFVLQSLCNTAKPTTDPILVILEGKGFDVYAAIKRAADLRLGYRTVCVAAKETLISNFNPHRGFAGQKASNIALKYNIKGGCNPHVLKGTALGTLRDQDSDGDINSIVLGADVAHPGPGAITGCPSIAAVVGTIDNEFLQFPGSMRLQASRKEGIEDIAGMVYERLIAWSHQRRGRGKLPKRVLFYRDGVSESQYEYVRDNEIPQIQTAFNDAREYLDGESNDARQKDVDFQLTVVVAGKRHNTRFYPTSAKDTFLKGKGDPNGNVKPGLVVDKTITHPYNMDFFLQSHAPIQGTGRSAHYYVVTNGMDLDANALQNITHDFCYAYARATRGVSYCAPAYYADRLCDRGRAYLRHWLMHHDHPEYHLSRKREKRESHEQWCKFVCEDLHKSSLYRPYVGEDPPRMKYGRERMNPWHESLDDIMFYL